MKKFFNSNSLKQQNISSHDITPEPVFYHRREFLQKMMGASMGLGIGTALGSFSSALHAQNINDLPALNYSNNPAYNPHDKLTSFEDITHYNNFYEFGTDKTDPAANAHSLQTRPWTVRIEGLVSKPQTLDIDTLLKLAPLEERIYRLRCVEGWSMVIPWIGYSLSHLINKASPLGSAKYVQFISLADSKQMPELSSHVLNWPYQEGLRMDEAMHPLTMMVFGLYGKVLPKQDGAPLRLAVPWKYGFKSAKSLVTIRFVEQQPATSWNTQNTHEYGFYSNVNPQVDHPRWSQATERRIGEGIFASKHPTLMFNGYGNQVAQLYSGMDLKKYF
jgi:methionine sulfoxide reductase catalytic subunit